MAGHELRMVSLELRHLQLEGRFARPQKLQEVYPTVFAGLLNAQQYEIVLKALARAKVTDHRTVLGKRLDGILSVIVVPRHSVMVQKLK